MTENEIEIAARELCCIRKIDPDFKVSHGYDPQPGDTMIPAVLLHSPAWTRLAIEIRVFDEIQRAINYVPSIHDNSGDSL